MLLRRETHKQPQSSNACACDAARGLFLGASRQSEPVIKQAVERAF
jgi:hypothetical protein